MQADHLDHFQNCLHRKEKAMFEIKAENENASSLYLRANSEQQKYASKTDHTRWHLEQGCYTSVNDILQCSITVLTPLKQESIGG